MNKQTDLRGKDELLHEMALRLTKNGLRCKTGCAECPMANARDENNNCLTRRLAKVKNAEEQVGALCDWAWENPPEPELLPCPFCGGKAIVVLNARNKYTVKCTNAQCEAMLYCKGYNKRSEAAEAWNRRTGNG